MTPTAEKAKRWATLSIALGSLGLGLVSLGAPKKNSGKDFTNEINAALPKSAQVKAKSERKILVFAVTNGFRNKSIPTG